MRKISKQLSYILRHNPESIGCELDENGYVQTSLILDKLNITYDQLKEIVNCDDKKRFGFNDDETMIRANQGHSLDISIKYDTIIPPNILYHGTPDKNVDIILKNGLGKMNRTHVHLSKDIKTASVVGSRRGSFKILEIDTKSMIEDGYVFNISENGVYLIDNVPNKYINLYKY